MVRPLRAITLWRPWPWAIIHLGKDVENRDWRPAPSLLAPGDCLAIHAGKAWDAGAAIWLEGACSGDTPIPAESWLSQGIVAIVRFAGVVETSTSTWFVGRYGWRIEDVVPLPRPVPCRGAQGLWTVPDELLSEAREQYRAGRALLAERSAAR